MEYNIIEGRVCDAPFIARAIMTAIGADICGGMAGCDRDMQRLESVFTRLAARDDSQYSYRNALIAVDNAGNRAGAVIVYDGARLHELRRAFVEEYNKVMDTTLNEADLDDETSEDEIYIDTLMVAPDYRRQGLGAMLVEATVRRYAQTGKSFGLLVDYENKEARKLYEKLGFTSVGERRFCGTAMEHMQRQGI